MFLATAAATAWQRMHVAAKAATGATLRITPPNGAYRDLAAQKYMFENPLGPVPIAPPGFSSHGDGRAVDISNFNQVYNWLRNHAHEFGFTQQFSTEPWHWKHNGTSSAGGGTEITSKKENDMPAVIKRTEGTPEWSLIWPPLAGVDDLQKGYVVTNDPERAKWWTRFYELGAGTEDKFTRDEYIAAQKYARLDHEAWLRGQVAGGAQQLTVTMTGTATPA